MTTKLARKTCDSCQMVTIQGLPCHETGCPQAWRDTPKKCSCCGFDFTPKAFKYERTCADCINDENQEDA